MMNGRWAGLVALLVVYAAVSLAAGETQTQKHGTKVNVIAPETGEGLEGAQPPSDAVLDALLDGERVRNSKDQLEGLGREELRKLFDVVPVSLAKKPEEDYVVTGHYPMGGADNHWFWVVRVRRGKGEVLLFTQGLVVELLRKRTNGYRDIRESWGGNSGSVTRTYRFSGSAYNLAVEHSEEAKP